MKLLGSDLNLETESMRTWNQFFVYEVDNLIDITSIIYCTRSFG